MRDWSTVSISDFGKVVTGKTPPSARPQQFGEEHPFITPSDMGFRQKHVETERFLSEQGIEAHRRSAIPPKSVCVVCIASIGKVCMTEQSSLSNQQINSIVVDSKAHDADFVYYLACLLRPTLEAYASGAATPIVNKGTFSKIKLRVPPKDTQEKIAAILTAYDDLIENNRQRIALLEKMAEEIYREWFVRLRFPGHEHTPVHKGVPEGWTPKRIGEVVQFKSGFPFKSSTYEPDGKFGVVTIKNVHDGKFVAECSDHISAAPSKLPKHCYLQDGDILMSLTGNVGRVCLALGENLLLNQRVALLKPTNAKHSHFIYWAFRQKSMLTFCELISTGAAQQNLSPIKLSRQIVVYPSDNVVETFQSSITPLMSEVNTLQKSSALLANTRDLLLNRLISGKLRVDDLDIQFPPSMQYKAA